MVEPTEHLYREGNVIGKYQNNKQKKKKHNKEDKENNSDKKLNPKKAHKEGIGNLVDIEV